MIVTTPDDFAAVTACAALIDNVKTLNASIWFDNYGYSYDGPGVFDRTVDFGDIEVITGSLSINHNFTSCPPQTACLPPLEGLVLKGPRLQNLTGAISLYDIVSNGSPSNGLAPVEFRFPALEYLAYLSVNGAFVGFPLYFGPETRITSVGIWNSRTRSIILGTMIFDSFDFRGNDMRYAQEEDNVIFSNATSMNGTLEVYGNIGLTSVSFPALEWARGVRFLNNSGLQTLDLAVQELEYLRIDEDDMRLLVSFNHLKVIQYRGTFRGIARLGLPVLEKTTSSTTETPEPAGLRFEKNAFPGLQLPYLSSVNGSFAINDNPALFLVEFPRFEHIHGDLSVKNNTLLQNFTANVLKRVKSIEMVGSSFTNVEFFSLQEVEGDFYLEGGPSMDCTWFDDNFKGKVVKGQYTCIGNSTYPPTPRRPSTPTTLPGTESPREDETESPPSEGNKGPSTGAKAGIGVGAAVGGLALIGMGAWAFALLKRRRAVDPPSAEDIGKPELDGDEKKEGFKTTVVDDETPKELGTDGERRELEDGSSPKGEDVAADREAVATRESTAVELP